MSLQSRVSFIMKVSHAYDKSQLMHECVEGIPTMIHWSFTLLSISHIRQQAPHQYALLQHLAQQTEPDINTGGMNERERVREPKAFLLKLASSTLACREELIMGK